MPVRSHELRASVGHPEQPDHARHTAGDASRPRHSPTPASSLLTPNSSPLTRHSSAFTLIELLVVVAILAVLIGLITAAGGAAMNYARDKEASTELATMYSAVEMFRKDFGKYAPDYQNATFPLQTLVVGGNVYADPGFDASCAGAQYTDPLSINGQSVPGWILPNNEMLAYFLTRRQSGEAYLKHTTEKMLQRLPLALTATYCGSPVNRLHLVDPWGTPYLYQATGAVRLQSAGRDGQFDTTDDLYFPER